MSQNSSLRRRTMTSPLLCGGSAADTGAVSREGEGREKEGREMCQAAKGKDNSVVLPTLKA